MITWQWKEEWQSFYRDNGKNYVLIHRQLFGRFAIQFYETLDSLCLVQEKHTYDFEKAFDLGNEWLRES